MPWGKHRGCPLPEVPLSYLAWVLESCDQVRPSLRQAIEAEIRQRVGGDPQAPPPPPPRRGACPSTTWAQELVGAGLRALAVKHHPDKGGDLRAMQEINAVADWLRATARGGWL